MKRSKWMSVLMLSAMLCGGKFAHADDGHADHRHERPETKAPAGPHGGAVSAVGDYHCEVVFQPKSVRVYLFDAEGHPVPADGVRASITLKLTGNAKEYRYELRPEPETAADENSLSLAIDLSRVPDEAMTTSFVIQGLPSAARQPLSFAQTFRVTRDPEQLAIARQKICPVSGKPLDSMGRSIRMTVEGRDVYVCCQGCVNALKRDPAKYLARLPDPAPSRADEADAAGIERQRLCPVMDEPLGSMGVPWKVTVKGQDVFVCCKGCIGKVQRNPELYLSKTGRSEQTGRPAE